MSLIEPFRGIYYNSYYIKDLAKVVCPPYDVMDKKEENFFRRISPYNFCNILKKDNTSTYAHLKHTFRKWLEEKILIQDKKPYFYLYEQTFKLNNKKKRRVGLLGLLRIDKEKVIFPHEYTFSSPKKDRYYIIKEFNANLSPIFVIVPNKISVLNKIYKKYQKKRPFINFLDLAMVKNKVWRIENKKSIDEIRRAFLNRKVFIADGHHRFEVACKYFRETKGKLKGANYILTYFTDTSNGLTILPTHRIVKLVTSFNDSIDKFKKYFNIISVTQKYLREKINQPVSKEIFFGMYYNNQCYILKLKSKILLDKIFKKDIVYRNLDVYILHRLVLKFLNNGKIKYTHSLDEAMKLSNKKYISFILKPTSLRYVFEIAKKGYRLPHKSTYFYPKLLSGILMRRFES